MSKRWFASDNNSGIHPEILDAIIRANEGHAVAYGADPWTERAVAAFRREFGPEVDVHFVFNGTAANVLSLQAMTRPHNAVICSEHAHIHLDECGAPERFTGCKLLPLPASNGKITADSIRAVPIASGNQHAVQPRVVSISQTTELGTVYSREELKSLSAAVHERGMLLHVDGARISNAAASLGASLKEASRGADILSFGGTKNGLMGGEAIVVLNPKLREDFQFIRKQGMQLASKMRFLASQFEALLSNELWLRSARHSNSMARLLESELKGITQVKLIAPVEANAVFVQLPAALVKPLQDRFFFHVWDTGRSIARWMTSFDTAESDVRDFASSVREILKS